MKISEQNLKLILNARHSHPHSMLGMHPAVAKKTGIFVRAFIRDALECSVVDLRDEDHKRYPMEKLADEGFFEVFIPKEKQVFPYRLRIKRHNGEVLQFYDPYSFLPTFCDEDLYLFNEGNLHHVFDKLGSHVRKINGVEGVSFAVWAPTARRVSVVGDFNHYDGRYHMMRSLGSSGVWEIFIPGVEEGMKYKYEILSQSNQILIKTDPYGVYFEAPPNNATKIYSLQGYQWNDQDWMEDRPKRDWKKEPISIYEVHFGSWRRVVEDNNRPFSYVEMAHILPKYVKRMGFTHVEFMPIAEHPYNGSWGYQVTGFFAPTQRFGSPKEFMYLVDMLHREGIGVIMDWVPGHFPKDAFALAEFDGSYLYEHEDPRLGHHQDWGTLIFNYGRHEVQGFLLASALSWLDRFHIDGLRVDAVASMLYLDYSRKEGEWIPNKYGGRENIEAIEFIKKTNHFVHKYFPGALMIAEESTAFGGVTRPVEWDGLGFDFKWNMGWMHDTLLYFSKDPIYRKSHHNNLTFGMLYQYTENFISPFSHDEVVHGKNSLLSKMPVYSIKDKAQSLRALFGFMWTWPGKKLLFMGQEFGQSAEWYHDRSLDWHLLQYDDHLGVQKVVEDLNRWYRSNPGIAAFDETPEGFQWVNADDQDNSCVSFLRLSENNGPTFLIIGNFTPVPRQTYRIGVPNAGGWEEVLNTNATVYGGSGSGNPGVKQTQAVSCNGRPHSLELFLPGMSVMIYKYVGE